MKFLKKLVYLLFLVFLFIFSMYLQVTSVSVLTHNEIIHHTFYNPVGTIYSYENIRLVDIGSENSNDAYYQIENIDKIIMPKKVLKSSSLEYIEAVDLDKKYADRFKRIIENK